MDLSDTENHGQIRQMSAYGVPRGVPEVDPDKEGRTAGAFLRRIRSGRKLINLLPAEYYFPPFPPPQQSACVNPAETPFHHACAFELMLDIHESDSCKAGLCPGPDLGQPSLPYVFQ